MYVLFVVTLGRGACLERINNAVGCVGGRVEGVIVVKGGRGGVGI